MASVRCRGRRYRVRSVSGGFAILSPDRTPQTAIPPAARPCPSSLAPEWLALIVDGADGQRRLDGR